MTEKDFSEQAEIFLQNLFDQLQNQQIRIEQHWQVDHLCFRVATSAEYEVYKLDFLKFGQLLIESEVNGRPISTFKLVTPIWYKTWMIDVVELPAPKPGKLCKTGFEHVEVVIDIPFTEIKSRNSGCQFDETGLHKNFNKELEIKLHNSAIKFHYISLLSVVQLERNLAVYHAINNLKILSNLKAFSPLIAGTYPLDLSVPTSDVDLLLQSDDFDLVTDTICRHYDQFQDFKKTQSSVQDQTALVFNFHFQNVAFEIFIQNTEPVLQRAYQHFLLEERLLKVGGSKFKESLTFLRKSGLKTEVAFGTLLGLDGDDFYQDLLGLKNKSEIELRKIILTI